MCRGALGSRFGSLLWKLHFSHARETAKATSGSILEQYQARAEMTGEPSRLHDQLRGMFVKSRFLERARNCAYDARAHFRAVSGSCSDDWGGLKAVKPVPRYLREKSIFGSRATLRIRPLRACKSNSTFVRRYLKRPQSCKTSFQVFSRKVVFWIARDTAHTTPKGISEPFSVRTAIFGQA